MIDNDKYFVKQKFRPNPFPNKDLPLGLRGVGHYFVPQDYPFPEMYSTYVVLAWVVSGSIKVQVEDIGTFNMTASNFMVITLGLKYKVKITSDDCEFVYLSIDGEQAQQTILSMGLWTGLFPCRNAPIGWIKALCELLGSNNEEQQILAVSRAHDLLVFYSDLTKELSKDNLVYQAQWYFQRNFNSSEINVDSLISYLDVDRTTISKRFKNKTGMSPLEYLTTLRISHARKLLSTTTIPISKIASLCGYGDPSYFSRLFKNKTGIKPLDCRFANKHKVREQILQQQANLAEAMQQ